MTKIFNQVLSAVAVVGVTVLAAAVPASANSIGDTIGAIQIGSQNLGANSGNVGSVNNHGSSNGNSLANNIADQSVVGLVNDVDMLNGAFALV
ncbi:hypothetical protein [Streptacidiphilus sp. PAMC 29251]